MSFSCPNWKRLSHVARCSKAALPFVLRSPPILAATQACAAAANLLELACADVPCLLRVAAPSLLRVAALNTADFLLRPRPQNLGVDAMRAR